MSQNAFVSLNLYVVFYRPLGRFFYALDISVSGRSIMLYWPG
nr:MAG TPA: hypothetical protein [Caudoviricetes sp.]